MKVPFHVTLLTFCHFVLVFDFHAKVMVCGDSFQNFSASDPYFNYFGRFMMRMMGFIKPANVGPGFYGAHKPDSLELEKILREHDFDHLLPSHGEPVLGRASQKFEPSVKALKRHDKYM